MAWCGRVAASFASFVQDFCALRRCREFAPAGDLLYCCATGVPAQNKVGKQMRPTSSVPKSFALRSFWGNLRSEQIPACGITRCALKRSTQTDAASQSTKFGCPSAAKPPVFAASAGAG